MRLFGKVDGSINRYDRAVWLTWGFDRTLGASAVAITAHFDVTPCVSASFDVTA